AAVLPRPARRRTTPARPRGFAPLSGRQRQPLRRPPPGDRRRGQIRRRDGGAAAPHDRRPRRPERPASRQPRMALPRRHRYLRRRRGPAQLAVSAAPAAWSYQIVDEPDATCRVEVTDEDGAMLPVARQVSRAQAEMLIER